MIWRRKDERTRDEGFERIVHVSGEVAKNVDYSSGKAGNEQGKRS